MLLAVDTSTKMVGLALYDGAQVMGELVWQTRNHHTVELAPAVESMLSRCGLTAHDLSVLAVALGPGSFTSLRIGLAFIKGMALTLHLPVVGVPSLDVLAASQPLHTLPMVTLLQAGRDRFALAWYEAEDGAWKVQGDAAVVNLEALTAQIKQPTLVVGELRANVRQILERTCKDAILVSPARSMRRPSYLAEIAWKRWQSHKVDDVVTLSPIYLHTADSPSE